MDKIIEVNYKRGGKVHITFEPNTDTKNCGYLIVSVDEWGDSHYHTIWDMEYGDYTLETETDFEIEIPYIIEGCLNCMQDELDNLGLSYDVGSWTWESLAYMALNKADAEKILTKALESLEG